MKTCSRCNKVHDGMTGGWQCYRLENQELYQEIKRLNEELNETKLFLNQLRSAISELKGYVAKSRKEFLDESYCSALFGVFWGFPENEMKEQSLIHSWTSSFSNKITMYHNFILKLLMKEY